MKDCGYKKGGKTKKKAKVAGEKGKARLDKFARGGKAGHKTQVNVMVGGGPQSHPPMPMGAPAGPMPGAAPPMGIPPRGGLPGGSPGARPPGLKTGGKVPHMTAGALSGKGRLEKRDLQKSKR